MADAVVWCSPVQPVPRTDVGHSRGAVHHPDDWRGFAPAGDYRLSWS